MRYFSMFSGIGGFELGIQRAFSKPEGPGWSKAGGSEGQTSERTTHKLTKQNTCIGYSEIDKYAIKVYERNFNGETDNEYAHIGSQSEQEERSQRGQRSSDKRGVQLHAGDGTTALRHRNFGDATLINPSDLPDFDLLVGGFPCQAFSVAGKRAGFKDTRGTLFFDIARILKDKRPGHLVLENVKGLLSHDNGKTFQTILGVLSDLGYRVEWQVLNSKDFGVPQNRERIYIIGHLGGECGGQVFPIGTHYGEDTKLTRDKGQAVDLTLRANGGHRTRTDERFATIDANYYKGIANQERPGVKEGAKIRRLTPKECERLQGFPDDWTKYGVGEEPISDTQRYKMCGNAVTVNVVEAVMRGLMQCL